MLILSKSQIFQTFRETTVIYSNLLNVKIKSITKLFESTQFLISVDHRT